MATIGKYYPRRVAQKASAPTWIPAGCSLVQEIYEPASQKTFWVYNSSSDATLHIRLPYGTTDFAQVTSVFNGSLGRLYATTYPVVAYGGFLWTLRMSGSGKVFTVYVDKIDPVAGTVSDAQTLFTVTEGSNVTNMNLLFGLVSDNAGNIYIGFSASDGINAYCKIFKFVIGTLAVTQLATQTITVFGTPGAFAGIGLSGTTLYYGWSANAATFKFSSVTTSGGSPTDIASFSLGTTTSYAVGFQGYHVVAGVLYDATHSAVVTIGGDKISKLVVINTSPLEFFVLVRTGTSTVYREYSGATKLTEVALTDLGGNLSCETIGAFDDTQSAYATGRVTFGGYVGSAFYFIDAATQGREVA